MAKKNKDEEGIQSPEELKEFLETVVKAAEERGVEPAELIRQYVEYQQEHGDFGDEAFLEDEEFELSAEEKLLEEAFETDIPEEKVRLAHEVLALDPENLMAMHILTDELEDPKECLEWAIKLEDTAAAGLDDDFFEEHHGEFSAFAEGRDYLEAALKLANKLTGVLQFSEAIELMEELMELDIDDNLRVRDFLLPVYAVTRKFNAYERLREEFDDEPTVATTFNHVLYTAVKHGAGLKANHALKKAIEQHGNIFDLLNSEKALEIFDEDPDDAAESMSYLMDTVHLWFVQAKIREWLTSTVVDTEELFKGFED